MIDAIHEKHEVVTEYIHDNQLRRERTAPH